MTAIAAFRVDSVPVIFGDLLLTGPSEVSRPFSIPAIGDVQDFFGSGWSILGLQQKVVLISERCVLAWAGSYIAAKTAISDLKSICEKTNLTTEEVRVFLSTHPDVMQHGVSFVGWVHEKENKRFGQFHHNAEALDAGNLGTMYLDGSGTGAIKELVEVRQRMHGRSTGEVTSAVNAISTGFSMAGTLLRAEMQGGDAAPTLRAMFGGGYEVAVFMDGGFKKVGNLTFLFWSARVTKEGVDLAFPELILKQVYVRDNLLILSARVSTVDGQPSVLMEEQKHIIKPMYTVEQAVTQEELAGVSYESSLLCHCFLVHGADAKDLMVYTRVQRTGGNSNPMMKIENHEDRINLMFNNELIREIAGSLSFASHQPR